MFNVSSLALHVTCVPSRTWLEAFCATLRSAPSFQRTLSQLTLHLKQSFTCQLSAGGRDREKETEWRIVFFKSFFLIFSVCMNVREPGRIKTAWFLSMRFDVTFSLIHRERTVGSVGSASQCDGPVLSGTNQDHWHRQLKRNGIYCSSWRMEMEMGVQ